MISAVLTSYTEALNILDNHTQRLSPQTVPLLQGLNHRLAEPLISPHDMPHFDQSAMDGYTLCWEARMTDANQLPLRLKVVGEVRAERLAVTQANVLQPGEAIRIFTGAPIPEGASAVVMQEDCEILGADEIRLLSPVMLGENIRPKGGEYTQGSTLLPAGQQLTPPALGMFASLGKTHCPIIPSPRVAILTTGSELVEPGRLEALQPGEVYDANALALSAALQSLGISQITTQRITEDVLTPLIATLQTLIETHDLVLTVGGISVGRYDLVKDALERINESGTRIHTLFWRVNMKPGKPIYCGKADTPQQTLIFGLPGNPVSALVSFQLFVLPCIRKLRGEIEILDAAAQTNLTAPGYLTETVHPDNTRHTFLRGRTDANQATPKENPPMWVSPTRGQESHMLSGLAQADCLLSIPEGNTPFSQGSPVKRLPLHWS